MNTTRFVSCFVYVEDNNLRRQWPTREKQLLAGRNARARARAHQPNRSPRAKVPSPKITSGARTAVVAQIVEYSSSGYSSSRQLATTSDVIELVFRACPLGSATPASGSHNSTIIFSISQSWIFFCCSSFQLTKPRVTSTRIVRISS